MKVASGGDILLGHWTGSLDMRGFNVTRQGDQRHWQLVHGVCRGTMGGLAGAILLWRRNAEILRRGLGRQRRPVLPQVDVREPGDVPGTWPDVAPDERRADPADAAEPAGPRTPPPMIPRTPPPMK
jgi:hypothetical protein